MSTQTCPVNYPTFAEIIPCLQEIYKIGKSGDIAANFDHAIKHVWCAAGGIASLLVGDPDVPPVIGDTDVSTENGALAVIGAAAEINSEIKGGLPISPLLIMKALLALASLWIGKRSA